MVKKILNQRKWPTIQSYTKARRGQESFGKKKIELQNKKQSLINQLSELRLNKEIKPKFSLNALDISHKTLISIQNGSVGYVKPILKEIFINLVGNDRAAISGKNGSGKTTLVKALLNDPNIQKTGTWYTPKTEEIGYLDQHYQTLDPKKTVFETIEACLKHQTTTEIRNHLKDFLFFSNQDVLALTASLSGV